jgi:hypothetical protein
LKAGWIEHLDDEDLAFIRRFVLASGSMKEVAQEYGVSYPTVRLRLDRLIAKIRLIEDQTIESEFDRALRLAFAEGRIDADTMKRLTRAHKKDLKGR